MINLIKFSANVSKFLTVLSDKQNYSVEEFERNAVTGEKAELELVTFLTDSRRCPPRGMLEREKNIVSCKFSNTPRMRAKHDSIFKRSQKMYKENNIIITLTSIARRYIRNYNEAGKKLHASLHKMYLLYL